MERMTEFKWNKAYTRGENPDPRQHPSFFSVVGLTKDQIRECKQCFAIVEEDGKIIGFM